MTPILYPFIRTSYGFDIFTTGSRWTSPLVTGALTVVLVALVVNQTPVTVAGLLA